MPHVKHLQIDDCLLEYFQENKNLGLDQFEGDVNNPAQDMYILAYKYNG